MNRYKLKLKTFQVVHEHGLDFGQITGPEDVVPLLKAILRDAAEADRETFIVIGLNSRGRAIGYKIISVGTLTASLVHPRDVFTCALVFRAAALIVAHSHPSGVMWSRELCGGSALSTRGDMPTVKFGLGR